jgi:transcriptional regulator with XRE-family HTH domain
VTGRGEVGVSFGEAFAAVVRERRERRGLLQEQIQEWAGLGRNYLTTLENGRSINPSLAVMHRLADALGCRLSDLIREAEEIRRA